MFHPLATVIEPPVALNNPFCYEPHALTLLAASQLCDYLGSKPEWMEEIAGGKMFGVLVCRDGGGRVGFLAAYSGQLAGRGDWPWFVPLVFDYLQPDGYFRQEESRISEMNRLVEKLESAESYQDMVGELRRVKAEGEADVGRYRRYMQECKQRRDALRARGGGDEQALVAESQFQKAELRRKKYYWQQLADRAAGRLGPLEERVEALKRERRRRSDALQQWLFGHFLLLNVHGESRSLTSIFAETPQGTPPSGAGECCAPKLLHYAFKHGFQPLCMGEFWQGRSPRMEVRHHGRFYPACRGKCKPILTWMLDLEESGRLSLQDGMEPDGHAANGSSGLEICHADGSIIVVNKPSGLLSVPGRNGLPSVESILSGRYGRVFMPHRLDQDTSGLLVVARTMDAYHHLQRQFLERTMSKEYEALLDGVAPIGEGVISLPLRPDLMDRPRQLVDRDHGKAATTYYNIINVENGRTRVLLVPHTGRTHQLRVHCAHSEGLGLPIAGDQLYGKAFGGREGRLCLHARRLAFIHPATLRQMSFLSPTPF